MNWWQGNTSVFEGGAPVPPTPFDAPLITHAPDMTTTMAFGGSAVDDDDSDQTGGDGTVEADDPPGCEQPENTCEVDDAESESDSIAEEGTDAQASGQGAAQAGATEATGNGGAVAMAGAATTGKLSERIKAPLKTALRTGRKLLAAAMIGRDVDPSLRMPRRAAVEERVRKPPDPGHGQGGFARRGLLGKLSVVGALITLAVAGPQVYEGCRSGSCARGVADAAVTAAGSLATVTEIEEASTTSGGMRDLVRTIGERYTIMVLEDRLIDGITGWY